MIAGIDLGDLHADRRIGGTGAFPCELRHLLTVSEDRDDRRARNLAVLAFVLAIAEGGLHRPLRDLLRPGRLLLLAAARLDLRRVICALDVGNLEIFGVDFFDGVDKAWGRIGGAWKRGEAEQP